MAFILLVNAMLQDVLNLVARHHLATLGLHRLREERLEQNNAEMRLRILTIHHTRDGRYVQPRTVGNILQDHRSELTLVAILEILLLKRQYLLHRAHQRVVALLDCRDKPLRRVDLALYELHRLAVLIRYRAIGRNHIAHHIHISAIDLDLGYVVRVERQVKLPVVVIDIKVGNNVWRGVQRPVRIEVSGLGREVLDLIYGIAELILRNAQTCNQFLVMFLDKFVEVRAQDSACQSLGGRIHPTLAHLQH